VDAQSTALVGVAVTLVALALLSRKDVERVLRRRPMTTGWHVSRAERVVELILLGCGFVLQLVGIIAAKT
jgi:hypothetical protein